MEGNRLAPTCRRADARMGLRGRATLVLPGRAEREAQLVDLAVNGLSLLTARPIAPGTRCTVDFELPFADHRSAHVMLQAKAVYSSYMGPDSFKIGLMFTAVDAAAQRLIDDFLG